MKIKKLFKKITENESTIIIGILSGSGLTFLTVALTSFLENYFALVYFLMISTAFYLFLLIGTSLFYTKGLMKKIFVVSSLILFLAHIYGKLT